MLSLLDLLRECGITAKRVAATHGGEYHSACPVCGGKDRFHCWPERQNTGSSCPVPGLWGCRSCDASGDAIAFLRHVQGLSFADACKQLGIRWKPKPYQPVRLPDATPRKSSTRLENLKTPQLRLPPGAWMQRNAKLVAHAHDVLLNTPYVLQWLAARGIDTEAVRLYRLGWLPGEKRGNGWYTRPLKAWGLPEDENKKIFRFPRGLVIPRFATIDGQEQVIALRIRRTDEDRDAFAPDTKYQAFKGCSVVPWLIAPHVSDMVRGALVVMESELDGILVAETARRARLSCGALALASNTAKPDPVAHAACSRAARLLIALDFDPADSKGRPYTDKALAWWLQTYPRAKDWPVPTGKDPGEAYELGVDIRAWITAGLPPFIASSRHESAYVGRSGIVGLEPSGTRSGEGSADISPEIHALYEAWCAVPGFRVEKRENDSGWSVGFRCDEEWLRSSRENIKAVRALQEGIIANALWDEWVFERNPNSVVTHDNFFEVKRG